MKKACSLLLAGCIFASISAGAVETTPSTIPKEMLPNTIISFDEQCQMHIIVDGHEIEDDERSPSISNNEDTSGLEEEEALMQSIDEEAKQYPHYTIPLELDAEPGMVVVYASDGKIHRILRLEDDERKPDAGYDDALDYYGDYYPYSRGNHESNGTYDLGYGNTIKITSSYIQGTGRLSTFGELKKDAIGENGASDPNVTGDCATRGEMDNAPYHQQIQVRNLDNNIKKTLRKNDNGKLPFAVLDIYKWSGTYFGEKWSNGFTFENGRYYYEL